MQRLRTILAITAVRLSIAYSLIFGIVAVVLVLYMTNSTVSILRGQIEDSINTEIADLDESYKHDGLNGLLIKLERAAAAPGANLYVLTEPTGRIIAANIRDIESGVIGSDGWTERPFAYTRYNQGDRHHYYAIARIVALPNGMRLLVGRDLGEPERFRVVIGRAMIMSLGFMVGVGILTWLLVGRRALKRLDLVAKSTERIMAGDVGERLPVTGAGDEFDRLSTRLNTMLDRIARLDEGLKQVSDNIAHDLKTPLTRLRNKADQALGGASDSEAARAALQEVIVDTDQIIKTFNALLMISRVESGSAAAELVALDLSALVGDVAELYEPVAEEAGFAFELSLEPDLKIRGNRELLSQALSNLCDNALKYGHVEGGEGARLAISAKREDGKIRLEVGDNGPGIPSSEHERVTERFTRLEASRTLPGNGLGLSLVRAVAQLHGGTLEFTDANADNAADGGMSSVAGPGSGSGSGTQSGPEPVRRPGLRASLVLPAEPVS